MGSILGSAPALIGAGLGAAGGSGLFGSGVMGALGGTGSGAGMGAGAGNLALGLGSNSTPNAMRGLAQFAINPISPIGSMVSSASGSSSPGLLSAIGGGLQGLGSGAMVEGAMKGNPLAAMNLMAQKNAVMGPGGMMGSSPLSAGMTGTSNMGSGLGSSMGGSSTAPTLGAGLGASPGAAGGSPQIPGTPIVPGMAQNGMNMAALQKMMMQRQMQQRQAQGGGGLGNMASMMGM